MVTMVQEAKALIKRKPFETREAIIYSDPKKRLQCGRRRVREKRIVNLC